MATSYKQKDTGSEALRSASFEKTGALGFDDNKFTQWMDLVNQTNQATQEQMKNTQAILGQMVQLTGNLTNIVASKQTFASAAQSQLSTKDSSFAGERSRAQQRFKNSYPRIRIS